MSFLAICFAIILIVGLIGPANILKVLVIGIPLLIVFCLLVKKLIDKLDAKYSTEENSCVDRYFNLGEHFEQGYSSRPVVTGDYFSSSYQTYTFTSTYRYCKYANTSNCANCSRRAEHKSIDNQFYYGVSYNCKEYNDTYDD